MLLKFRKGSWLGKLQGHTRRRQLNVVLMIPISSERKSMGCVVTVEPLLDGGVHRLFMKDASGILTWKGN
jgi:hypothetical protein